MRERKKQEGYSAGEYVSKERNVNYNENKPETNNGNKNTRQEQMLRHVV